MIDKNWELCSKKLPIKVAVAPREIKTKENYEIFYSQMFENLKAFKEGKPIRVIQMLN